MNEQENEKYVEVVIKIREAERRPLQKMANAIGGTFSDVIRGHVCYLSQLPDYKTERIEKVFETIGRLMIARKLTEQIEEKGVLPTVAPDS
jgi:hypothetical protein